MILQKGRSQWKSSYASYGIVVLGSLGLVIRLGLAFISSGSNDIIAWNNFASMIDQVGVRYMYENVVAFNHPPLMGYLAQYAFRIAQTPGLSFAFVFKLPMILADVLTGLLLWKIWRRRRGPGVAGLAVAAFGGSLVSILVSAYHGNTDTLCAFLCLLSAYLSEQKRPVAGGLALAAALNVKLLPIVLIPAFIYSYHSGRDLIKFGAGLAAGILPFLPFLVCCGTSFVRNAINYNSNADYWGIMLFLLQAGKNPVFQQLAYQIGDFYLQKGRLVVMGLILLLSLWSHLTRRWSRYELGAMCFSIFLIFTPGFGVQYMVYVCPLLFAVSLSWATLYSVLAGIFLSLVYYSFWTGTLPLHSHFNTFLPMPAPLFGLIAWVLLIQFVLRRLCFQTSEVGSNVSKMTRTV